VQAPLARIGREQPSDRAGRGYARWTEADIRQSRCGDESGFDAKAIGQEAEQQIPLGFVEP
jgi:hypothetical protein